MHTQNVQFGLGTSMSLGSSTHTACAQIGNPADLWFRLNEKVAEKAEHSTLCEHLDSGHPCPSGLRPTLRMPKMAILPFCEGAFSFNLGHCGRSYLQGEQLPSTKPCIVCELHPPYHYFSSLF